ncbi:MAG: glycosyltransferase family 4 protein [Bacteroidales bacterium]|nr:glycosyltransferase family 4 protein [Bacteroidales bacterium]
MRILLIHQYFQEKDGSGGTRFNEMVKIWQEIGHDVVVITGNLFQRSTIRKIQYKGKFVVKTNQENAEVWRCYVSKAYNRSFIGRLWGYFSFVFSGLYAGLFKVKGKFDLILVTSPPIFVGIIAYVLSKVKRIPFVFEVRDLWPESAIDTGVIRNKHIIMGSYWFEDFIYKRAKLICVLTPAFHTKLHAEKHIPKEKIILIPNAADFELVDELSTEFDPDVFRKETGMDDNFVIIYIGAHGVANGLNQVLDVARLLKDTKVLFILIGGGMQKQKLVYEAKDKKINNIRFLDSMPKKEALKYVIASDAGASILIKNETFKTVYSNKTFDYMSCKKPILMVIDGISRELIETADAGIFVEPENPYDFEEKIRYYLANPGELKRQGLNGYKYAREHFDRSVLAKKYVNYLKLVIQD